jgi:hypothetical protein
MNLKSFASAYPALGFLLSFCVFPQLAVANDCPNALEYINSQFSEAERTIAVHYGKRFYTNGPGCTGKDFELIPNDPADFSSCSVGSGGRLKRFAVTGFKETDLVLHVSYVFEGGVISPSEVSSLIGNMPLEPTIEVPRPLQPLFDRTPRDPLYRSRDGSLLVRIGDQSPAKKPSQMVTVFNLRAVEFSSEAILQCLRAYGYVK